MLDLPEGFKNRSIYTYLMKTAGSVCMKKEITLKRETLVTANINHASIYQRPGEDVHDLLFFPISRGGSIWVKSVEYN